MQDGLSLFNQLLSLEESLLQPEVRKSKEELNNLLADDFVEFGSSGNIYYKKDVVDDLPMQSPIKMELMDFAVKALAPDVALTTYMVIKYQEQNNEKHYSLRSSIWRLKDDRWQMVFHQGTPTKLPFKRVAVVDIK